MALRLLHPFSFCAFALLHTALISEAAPFRRIPRAGRFGRHPQLNEIENLATSITGKSMSDSDALAQTLGSLFGDNSSSSSTADAPSATISDPFSEITGDVSLPSLSLPDDIPLPTISDSGDPFSAIPDVVSLVTSTATLSLPTGAGSDADDAWGLLSQIAGAIPTIAPSIPISNEPNSGSWTSSGGFEIPEADPYPNIGSFPENSGFPHSHHGHGGHGGHHHHHHSETALRLSDCAETYRAVAGDTCAAISSVFNISPVEFLRMNPTVGAACMSLEIGQKYCVRRGSARHKHTGLHNHPSNTPWGSGFGRPGMKQTGVFPPVVPGISQGGVPPSAPVSSIPNDMPVPPPPPTLPFNPTGIDPASTPPDPSSTSTGLTVPTSITDFNSTSDGTTAFNSTSDPISDSTVAGFNSTSDPLGDTPSGDDTATVSAAASQPSSNPDDDDPLSTLDNSDSFGMAARESAPSGPKEVKVILEADY
ncbi:hypothetical protein B0H19DRAFT_700666 [Mycena capillaripes]|nr:hypothetical protein B0H19DRAFT_700666 [Mycena capillaripes]